VRTLFLAAILTSLALAARAESLTLLPTKFTLDSPGDEEVDYSVNDSPSRQGRESATDRSQWINTGHRGGGVG
jgi:hypothetical protein